jgi:nicotinate phosphoribosyltransferase
LIVGPYEIFGTFENIIDGILARRSSVCNNCDQMLKLITPQQLIYMADRTDDYLVQPYDGYAAYVGGVRHFVTDASIELIKNKKNIDVTGTIPHALIQQYDGNLNLAMQDYIKEYGAKNAVALIDYHNDVQSEIKLLSKDFNNLFAVRVDTSANLIDEGLVRTIKDARNNMKLYGVSPELIKLTRKVLDESGFKQTKIIASSGIDVAKIKTYQIAKAPVDYYGVGSSLITRNIHFTADLVIKNGKAQAKTGRKLFMNINNIEKLHSYH